MKIIQWKKCLCKNFAEYKKKQAHEMKITKKLREAYENKIEYMSKIELAQ